MKNHLTEILLALKDAGVDFIIGGGVAAVLQGVERVTMDLDISILMEKSNLENFLRIMKDLGLKPRAPVPPEYLLNPENVQVMVKEKHALVFTFVDPDDPIRCVDLFLRQDHSYDQLIPDCDTISILGRSFLLLSKDKLIELKRRIDPPRTKDLIDIEELIRLKGDNSGAE